jgi:hypothetical protein
MDTVAKASVDQVSGPHPNWRQWPRRRVGAVAAVVSGLLAALVACGGGGVGTNGTGSPVLAGLNVGTVSGLGSVIVDGTRHDDSAARTEISRHGGDAEIGDAGIGHRVSLEFATDSNSASVLQRIELLPSVVGRVSERTGDTLGVLGQTITVNSDPLLGPVTVFEAPLTSLAEVGLGEVLEVHALSQRTGSGTSDVRLVATRIERRSALSGVRVSGTVAELAGGAATGGASRFRLGALTVQSPSAAVLVPPGVELQDGRSVTVYAPEASFDAATLTLTASRVQVTAVGGSATGELSRAGLVGGWTGAAFVLDGVNLLVDAGTVLLPAGVSVGNGAYVRATATLDTAGQWRATRIERLSAATVGAELRGTLDDWVASAGTFSLRDTKVTVTAATRLHLGDCRVTALVDGLYVEVKGWATAQGLTATSVACTQEPAGTTSRLKRRGVVLSADGATRQFTLRRKAGDPVLTVTWTDQTYLDEPLTAAALVALAGGGREVEVEGSLSLDARQMVARKVKLR